MGSTFIKEVFLAGFKSFEGKTSIQLDSRFNAIIGSSGSGKSSIVDGLCFALGLLPEHIERRENLTDLIFVGTKTRKPASMAVVTVVFDNAQNTFPDFAGKDLAISRDLNERGKSTYWLNGKHCTWEEILAQLAMGHIYPDGFHILRQGKICQLTGFNPDDRRRFIIDLARVQNDVGGIEGNERIELENFRKYMIAFNEFNKQFSDVYGMLSTGGIAKMILENPAKPLESGVVIEARPAGKKITSAGSLSWGEQTIITLAFVIAAGRFQRSPFLVIDEGDAALDGPDAQRVFAIIKELAGTTQFIITSRHKENIINADKTYGVSMKDSVTGIAPMS